MKDYFRNEVVVGDEVVFEIPNDGQLFCGCRREDCENYKTEECRKCLIKHLNDMENN